MHLGWRRRLFACAREWSAAALVCPLRLSYRPNTVIDSSTENQHMNTVTVTKRGADRIRGGHLWIYRSDIVKAEAEGGSVVVVRDQNRNFVGQAFFSDSSILIDRKSTRLNSSHTMTSRMPSSA